MADKLLDDAAHGVAMPTEAFFEDAHISWRHVDGPLLTWGGRLHWLTLGERASHLFGRVTANTLAQKHWRRDTIIGQLEARSNSSDGAKEA